MAVKKADFLATVNLFSHLKKEELKRLANQSRYCTFKFGDEIIREGERDDRLFILISGKVNVFKSYGTKKEKRLRTLEPPAYFGEIALIDDLQRSATVVALRDTKTLCLNKLNLDREIEKSPIIAKKLLQMLYRRLLAIEKTLVNATGGVIPICASCKKIINEKGSWLTIEQYIMDYTEYRLSHGICPECKNELLSQISNRE
ncbi:MAG: cyclic nucleotide-binding domain-containing protein [Desulfobacterales bacterium]